VDHDYRQRVAAGAGAQSRDVGIEFQDGARSQTGRARYAIRFAVATNERRTKTRRRQDRLAWARIQRRGSRRQGDAAGQLSRELRLEGIDVPDQDSQLVRKASEMKACSWPLMCGAER
jgi:hypothetical protein